MMAAMNSALGKKMGNTYAAATLLCFVAFISCLASWYITGTKARVYPLDIPLYYYMAGMFVALYILTITASAKTIGMANAIFLVLVGQIVAAALIDHFGLFNTSIVAITFSRATGISLIFFGIYLINS